MLTLGIAGFLVAMLLAMAVDTIVAGLRAVESVFTVAQLATAGSVGGVTALGWGIWRGITEYRALTTAPAEPKQLAASLRRELEVSDQRRAEVERLDITARSAYLLRADGEPPRLLLECDDRWVVFAPPGLPTDKSDEPTMVRQRWNIERLRWTHALLSLTGHGPMLEAEEMALPNGVFADLEGCEVLSRRELPHAVQGELPAQLSAYRG